MLRVLDENEESKELKPVHGKRKSYKDEIKVHSVWKSSQNVAFEVSNFGLFYQFCPTKIYMSGNTIWPKTRQNESFSVF